MSMYWVHRDGETTGPFAPGRIAQMIDGGQIGDDTSVCAVGTEEWIPAHIVAERPVPARPAAVEPKAKVARRPHQLIGGLLILVGIALLFSPLALAGLLLGIVGLALQRRQYHCAGCGNRVEKLSTLCPACRVPLRPWRWADTLRESRVSLVILGVAVVLALVLYVMTR